MELEEHTSALNAKTHPNTESGFAGEVDGLPSGANDRPTFCGPVDGGQLFRSGLPTRQPAFARKNVRPQQWVAVKRFGDGAFPSGAIDLAAEFELNNKCGR